MQWSKLAYGKFLPGAATPEDPEDCFRRHLGKINRGQVLEEATSSLRQTDRLKTLTASLASFAVG